MNHKSGLLNVFIRGVVVAMVVGIVIKPAAVGEIMKTFDWSHWLRHVDGAASIVTERETAGAFRKPWEEIQKIEYDYQAIAGRIERMEYLAAEAEISGLANEEQEVLKLCQELIEDSELLATCYPVAHILYYGDIMNETLAERDTRIYLDCVTLLNRMGKAIKTLENSPYYEIAAQVIPTQETSARKGTLVYRAMTQQEKELEEQKAALIKEYEGAWTVASPRFRKEEIYRELMAVNTELANLIGYDSYLDYAFAEIYRKDYTVAEIEQLITEIKEYMVPVYSRLNEQRMMIDWQDIVAIDVCPETILDTVEPYMGKIDRSLARTFAGMREYGLLDIEESSSKGESFSTSLPYFNEAFIFINPIGDYSDYFILIHEFGHFFHGYNQKGPATFTTDNWDVSEIHSQGLEMLFCEYSESMFGEETGKSMVMLEILQKVESICYSAMLAEFEMRAYRNPGMTVAEMDWLYNRLRREYGLRAEEGYSESYTWTSAFHIYQYPLHSTSYVTSGLSSLNLYTLAQSDRERAVAAYLEAAACAGEEGYRAVVKDSGLADIFEPGTVAEIMGEVMLRFPN